MNIRYELEVLLRNLSRSELMQALELAPTSFSKLIHGQQKQVSLKTLVLLTKLKADLRKRRRLNDVSLHLPYDLKPQFKFAAMHSLSPVSWAWSAFTNEPRFHLETGLWIVSRLSGPQILLSNHSYIPYDSNGPERALYRFQGGYWESVPFQIPDQESDQIVRKNSEKTESTMPPPMDKVPPQEYPSTTPNLMGVTGLRKAPIFEEDV